MAKGKKTTKKSSTKAASIPACDRKWRAECDASTLADAAAIRNDSNRLAAAKQAAKKLVAQKEQRAKDAVAEAGAIKKLAKE